MSGAGYESAEAPQTAPQVPGGVPRRTHPLTPVVKGLRLLPAGFAIGVAMIGDELFGDPRLLLPAGVLAAVLAVVATGASWVAWRRFGYWFDEDGDLRVDSGVLQRNERRLQLSRLQSVDVSEPLAARPFGLAAVKVEVAGAGESHVTIDYLIRDEAVRLRDELMRRAGGAPVGSALEVSEGLAARSLAEVDTNELVLSLLLRTSTAALVVLSAAGLLFTVITSGYAALALVLLTGGVPLFSVVSEYSKYHGFTVTSTPDGLRIRRGLATTVTNTVPLGRVHAVGVSQGWLWRRMGWVRVDVDLAGTPGSAEDRTSTVLLPVATWPVALEVLGHLMPGVDPHRVDLTPAPRRARWRAPWQWRHVGAGADDAVFVARRGRLTRHLTVVPHQRTQSVRVSQGPWQRLLRLSSLHIDLVPGPVIVVAPHMDRLMALRLADQQAARASAARRAERYGRPVSSMSPPWPPAREQGRFGG